MYISVYRRVMSGRLKHSHERYDTSVTMRLHTLLLLYEINIFTILTAAVGGIVVIIAAAVPSLLFDADLILLLLPSQKKQQKHITHPPAMPALLTRFIRR